MRPVPELTLEVSNSVEIFTAQHLATADRSEDLRLTLRSLRRAWCPGGRGKALQFTLPSSTVGNWYTAPYWLRQRLAVVEYLFAH